MARDVGLVMLECGGIVKEVYLVNGAPEYVTSNLAHELLGEYLVTQNVISAGEQSMALAMMPRFGNELIAAPGLENITWYGRGPAPTYVDRNYERIGVYKSTVDEQWNEFSKPQENSNKVDVRWMTLINKNGIGLRASGYPLSVSAYHYPKNEIELADYTFRLTRRPQVYLNLDLQQMGSYPVHYLFCTSRESVQQREKSR